MASTSAYFDLADRIVGGDLAEQLLAWRHDDHLSFRAIAIRLHDDHDIDVTDETVRRWIRDINATPLAKAAGE